MSYEEEHQLPLRTGERPSKREHFHPKVFRSALFHDNIEESDPHRARAHSSSSSLPFRRAPSRHSEDANSENGYGDGGGVPPPAQVVWQAPRKRVQIDEDATNYKFVRIAKTESIPRPPPGIHRAKTMKASGGSNENELTDADEEVPFDFPEEVVLGFDDERDNGVGGENDAPFLERPRLAIRTTGTFDAERNGPAQDELDADAEIGYDYGGGERATFSEGSYLSPDAEAGYEYGTVGKSGMDHKTPIGGDITLTKEHEALFKKQKSEDGHKKQTRSGKELWMKMRDRVKRGSFMVHSFASYNTDDTDGSLHGSIFGVGSIFGGADDSSVRRRFLRRDEGGRERRKSLADLDLPYEFTMGECALFISLYLLLGIVAYSYVFEKWAVVDSLYFCVITFCTVGYGDIAPSTDVGRMFTCLFAMVGIAFLGLIVGVVGSRMVEAEVQAVESANKEMLKKVTSIFRFKKKRDAYGMSRSFSQESSLSSLDSLGSSVHSLSSLPDSRDVYEDRRPLHDHFLWYKNLCELLCRYLPALVPLFLGSLLIAAFEGWDIYDATYFWISTTATIGYGDYAPKTTSMKWFVVFFVPLAVGAMGHLLGTVANFIIEKRREVFQKRLWTHDLKVGDLEAMDWDKDGAVTQLEYVEFMLLTLKKVDADLLQELHSQFQQLDITHSGALTKRDLQLLARKRLKRVRQKLALSAYKQKLLHTEKSSTKSNTRPRKTDTK